GTASESLTRQHLRVMIRDHDHLLPVRQINADDRIHGRNQDPQPGEPRVAVAITTGHTATVTHERPPPAMGHQARQAHQEDVPTSCIDTQNVFLCRGSYTLTSRLSSRSVMAVDVRSDREMPTGPPTEDRGS